MPTGRSGNQGNFSRGGRGNSTPNRGRAFQNNGPGQFKGNFNPGDQNNYDGDAFNNLRQNMEYAIQETERKLQALQIAYQSLNDADLGIGDQMIGSGVSGAGRGNSGGNQGGNRNFADSNDDTDGRTTAGRTHDAEEFSIQDLNNFLQTGARSTVDGSYDLRTKEGRALEAAGWVNDEGFPIQGRGRMFISDQVPAGAGR